MRRLVLLTTLALASAFAASARATIVERVVAVVGERPILLTDLRRRAKPFQVRIYATVQGSAQQAAQETAMFRDLLNRMIDDRLEEQAADKAHVSVSADEIDRSIKQKAEQVNLSTKELLSEARRQGFTEQDYRDEVRRQTLEGKLLQLRVLPRVRVTDQDARSAYTHWLKDIGKEKLVEVRMIAIRLTPQMTQVEIQAQKAVAEDIVAKAHSGTDFCQLVKQHSQSAQPQGSCGSTGLQPLSQLHPEFIDAVSRMKEKEVSEPIIFPQEAVIVLQLHKAPHVPGFEDVKEEMQQRAMGEVVERQRKLWLQELRRGLYIDVRL